MPCSLEIVRWRFRAFWMLPFLLFSGIPARPQAPEPAKNPYSEPETTKRYANMPEEAVPYRKFTKPYKEWYLDEER